MPINRLTCECGRPECPIESNFEKVLIGKTPEQLTKRFKEFYAWARTLRKQGFTKPQVDTIVNFTIDNDSFETFLSKFKFCKCKKALVSIQNGSNNLEITTSLAKQFVPCRFCLNCSNCCECVKCVGCKKSFSSVEDACKNCKSCENCCGCPKCRTCRKPLNESCEDCQVCHRCCKCEYAPRRFEQKPIFWAANRFHRKLNSSERFIAAEIEIAKIEKNGRKIGRVTKKWGGSIVSDGSLPSTGFEINTSPAGGDHFVTQINEICDELKNGFAYVNEKCGLHVHVDARDFKYLEIAKLMHFYRCIEPVLFAMVPIERRKSKYCKPCGDSYYLKDVSETSYNVLRRYIAKTVYPETDDLKHISKVLKKSKYNHNRYNALNLHSWFFRGTIECRIFNGSATADDIVNWGILWAQIMDYVHKVDSKELSKMEVTTPYKNLLLSVSPGIKEFIDKRILAFRGIKSGSRIKTMQDVLD